MGTMTEQIRNEVRLEYALKECRLAANLSIETIAKKLNLNTSVIRNIEEHLDDIIADEKYPRVYLRGYLANYSKIVGLPLIDAFPQYQQLLSSANSNRNIISQPLIPVAPKSSFKMLWVLLLLAIGIVFYLCLPSNTVDSLSGVEGNVSMQLPAVIEESEVSVTDPIVLAVTPVVEKQKSAMVTAPSTATVLNSTPLVVANTEITDGAVSHALKEKNVEQKLRLYFKDECWVEISDADGNRIAFGLYKNGNELNLAGMAPFNLKLGNPAAVDIFYQNQLIEKEFAVGKSSRFNLPE